MADCELCAKRPATVFFRHVPHFGVKHICDVCDADCPNIWAKENRRLEEEEEASKRSVELTRAQIRKGTLDTPEKLSVAVEKCLNTLPEDGSHTTEG